MTDELAPPPSIKASWVFGIVAIFLLFILIATYSSRMAKDVPDYDSMRNQERLDILHKQQASDNEALTTAAWIDQTKGTVRIPIDEALPQAVAALKAKPVQMGAAIPGSAPATTAPNTAPAAPGAGEPNTNAASGATAPQGASAANGKPKGMGPAAQPSSGEKAPNK